MNNNLKINIFTDFRQVVLHIFKNKYWEVWTINRKF